MLLDSPRKSDLLVAKVPLNANLTYMYNIIVKALLNEKLLISPKEKFRFKQADKPGLIQRQNLTKLKSPLKNQLGGITNLIKTQI